MLNPIVHIVEGYRVSLLGKASMDIVGFLYLMCIAVIIFTFGLVIFKKLEPSFADFL
jgi:ABC-type polysaccharide/polyol phosphate export permease